MSLADIIAETGAFKTGEFTLSSGKTSSFYVDAKLASTDPTVLRTLAQHGAVHVVGHDAVAGTALGGVPLAVALGLETGRPTLLVRSSGREHGTEQRIEGPIEEGQRVLVAEDVVTTGKSLADAIETLEAAGAEVDHALVIVDREEGARELLKEMGIALHALVTLTELEDAAGVSP